MSPHYCKVGKIKPSLTNQEDLNQLETNCVKFAEVDFKKHSHKDLLINHQEF
jgi:hypothetical protein